MTVEQWGIRVPARQGEAMRQELIREGALDPSLKVLHEGSDLILPVLTKHEGADRYEFDAHPGRDPLPRHELVGGIAILQEDDPAGAEKILGSRPSLHTAVFAKGEVSGEYRTRELVVLAGRPTTRTEVTEHGHRFTVDLAGAYFSARLSTERQRILDQVKESEIILDMFAGVGPFAITLSAKAALVAASDINPQAVALMLENIARNHAKNVLPILADARRLIAEHTGKPVVHLCYPWHVSGPTARRIAAEVGYETAFCGKVPGVPVTLPGGDLRSIARIGEDYVELLPGRGRATLAEVLRRKWVRRFGGALR